MELKFNDKKFRIMQIADVQEAPDVSPDTVKLLSLAIKREKPDLVIFTGDQIYGPLPFYRFGDTKKKLDEVISRILSPVISGGVPFAVTFGNHDSECGVSNFEQAEIYFSKPGCIRPEYRSEEDKGTFLLQINGENGEPAFNILVFDSNGQLASGEYLPVKKEQLDWFRLKIKEQEQKYGGLLPTLVFQHIPVPEYYNVLNKVKRGRHGAVEAFRTHKNEFYVLPESVIRSGGFMGESPATPDKNSGEFDLLKNTGKVLGIFAGHDHNNSFVSELDGIKLVYTQCAGFNVYGPHLKRGVRIIELNEDDKSSFDTYTVTFEELTQDKLSFPVREFVLTHIPTSLEQVKRIAAAGAGAGALLLLTAAVFLKKKNKKSGKI